MFNHIGTAHGIKNAIIGKVVTPMTEKCLAQIMTKESFRINITADDNARFDSSLSCLVIKEQDKNIIEFGDIIEIRPSGEWIILYKQTWENLTLYMTGNCNNHCIMCPQIDDVDGRSLYDTNKRVLELLPENVSEIGITGGEPTLYKENFVDILRYAHNQYKDTLIVVLTNGRTCCDREFVKKIKDISHHKLMMCIPLYAPNYIQHNRIVAAQNAFQETIAGIFNLYRYNIFTEIRIVVMKQNFYYLSDIAEFIFRNMPFVIHVTFMGMEYAGDAIKRLESLWIDPYEYMDQLKKAVWFLHRRNINVSIYNIPLCLLDSRVRNFARDSISPWKKGFLSICNDCKEKERCSGIFLTSIRQSSNIKPL